MQYVPPINGDTGNANRPYINANPVGGIEGSIPAAAAIEHPIREIVNAIAGAGLTPNGANLSQLLLAIQTIAAAAVSPYTEVFSKQIIHVREEQTSGTAPSPTGLSTGFNTRTLNAVKKNTISGASLSGNVIFLPAGTYNVVAYSTAQSGSSGIPTNHSIHLKDTTNNAYRVNGLIRRNVQTQTGVLQTDFAVLQGDFTVPAGGANHEISHYTSAAQGIGSAVTSGQPEVYTDVLIRKVP